MRCLGYADVTDSRRNDHPLVTWIAVKNVGKSMMRILDISDLSTHNQHIDHIQFQEPGEFLAISVVNSNTYEQILDHAVFTFNSHPDRRIMDLRRGCTVNYRNL